MVKISPLYVANPGNSLAITCDGRLDLKDVTSSSTRPGINQWLLKFSSPLVITGDQGVIHIARLRKNRLYCAIHSTFYRLHHGYQRQNWRQDRQ